VGFSPRFWVAIFLGSVFSFAAPQRKPGFLTRLFGTFLILDVRNAFPTNPLLLAVFSLSLGGGFVYVLYHPAPFAFGPASKRDCSRPPMDAHPSCIFPFMGVWRHFSPSPDDGLPPSSPPLEIGTGPVLCHLVLPF